MKSRTWTRPYPRRDVPATMWPVTSSAIAVTRRAPGGGRPRGRAGCEGRLDEAVAGGGEDDAGDHEGGDDGEHGGEPRCPLGEVGPALSPILATVATATLDHIGWRMRAMPGGQITQPRVPSHAGCRGAWSRTASRRAVAAGIQTAAGEQVPDLAGPPRPGPGVACPDSRRRSKGSRRRATGSPRRCGGNLRVREAEGGADLLQVGLDLIDRLAGGHECCPEASKQRPDLDLVAHARTLAPRLVSGGTVPPLRGIARSPCRRHWGPMGFQPHSLALVAGHLARRAPTAAFADGVTPASVTQSVNPWRDHPCHQTGGHADHPAQPGRRAAPSTAPTA